MTSLREYNHRIFLDIYCNCISKFFENIIFQSLRHRFNNNYIVFNASKKEPTKNHSGSNL